MPTWYEWCRTRGNGLATHIKMKRPKPYGDSFTCPDCKTQTDIIVYPYIPAITAHCYDDNEPPEGGYTEPEECPECGCGIDYEDYAE